jgi:hypothetical protein
VLRSPCGACGLQDVGEYDIVVGRVAVGVAAWWCGRTCVAVGPYRCVAQGMCGRVARVLVGCVPVVVRSCSPTVMSLCGRGVV